MATIIQKQNKSIEIRYHDSDGKRRSVYPGKIAKRDAETIGNKIDHIVSRQVIGADPERAVIEWLAELPERLYLKLVNHRLAPERVIEDEPQEDVAPTIEEWTKRYVKGHSAKDSTIEQLDITARALCKKFGPERRINTITAGDAEDFRKWLETKGNERKKYKTGLAKNTVRRRIGRSKQFFRAAVKHQLIASNPFEGEASAVGGNEERLFLVPADWIERCIRKAPCEDWRIILAFARYAGMRSHETRIQRWDDIDLPNNRMVVRSNKTPPVRGCPIFPELRPHLLRAREMAPEGAEFVQSRYTATCNIGTELGRIITAAGLVPWPKLMQNLRATRETELLAHYPAKDVTSWLGNSPAVANKHYAMQMQESFDRAITDGARIVGVTTTASGVNKANSVGQPKVAVSNPPQNPPPTEHDKGGHSETGERGDSENAVNDWVRLAQSLSVTPLGCPTRT